MNHRLLGKIFASLIHIYLFNLVQNITQIMLISCTLTASCHVFLSLGYNYDISVSVLHLASLEVMKVCIL